MVLSLAIVGVTVFLFSNVVKFQTHPFFEAVREGDYKDLICSLPIAILFIVLLSLERLLTGSFTPP
jgi:uncharacterized membrane protein YGL010W